MYEAVYETCKINQKIYACKIMLYFVFSCMVCLK